MIAEHEHDRTVMPRVGVSYHRGMTGHHLVYDRDCAFCNYMVDYARAVTGDRVAYLGYQEEMANHPDIGEDAFRASIYLFSGDQTSHGAEAAFRTLAIGGRGWWLACYRRLPGFAPIAERAYGFVSRRRNGFALLCRWLFGPTLRPASHDRISRYLTAGIGLCALLAFASLWWQVSGLVGSEGILPYGTFLDAVHDRFGPEGYWWVPTLAWLSRSDLLLQSLCAVGVLASGLLLVGRLRASSAFVAYTCYLSLVGIGQTFLAFQWDTLLLECLVVAIVAARAPSWGVWTARLLLLRFMLLSGAVKLLSGDPTWADGTALFHHFETQPLPTALAWSAHQLPGAVLRAGVWMTFFIELVLPLLILLPQRPRLIAGAGFVLLEVLIAFTGSYNFFNLLTVVLCIALLNDRSSRTARTHSAGLPSRVCAAALMISGVVITATTLLRQPTPAPLSAIEPLRIINPYGLFAVMTTERRELVIEGSLDGREWQPYRFPFKPGDPAKAPRLAAPHQPRLDWQMWFAALGTPAQAPWVYDLVQALLENRPAVLELVDTSFTSRAPTYVRILSYRYRFTTADKRAATGNWWHVDDERVWLEPVRLRRPVIRHEPLTLE